MQFVDRIPWLHQVLLIAMAPPSLFGGGYQSHGPKMVDGRNERSQLTAHRVDAVGVNARCKQPFVNAFPMCEGAVRSRLDLPKGMGVSQSEQR